MASQTHVIPERWSPRGEAWVRGKGRHREMLVWSGIPGEGANVRAFAGGQHQVHAEWIGSKQPDPHRVEPPCERYTSCGGCPWMHLDPTGQEQAHVELVRDAFAEVGWDRAPIAAWHPSPDGLVDFRHVIKLGVGLNDDGRTRVGAWGRASRRIVPIPQCNVAKPVLRKVMVSFAHHTMALEVWPWEPGTDRGVLRAAVLRASRTTDEVVITLVAARSSPRLRDLAEAVAGACNEVVGVWLHLNDEPGNAIFARDDDGEIKSLPLVGKELLEEKLNGVTYRIGPGDFFQTNPAVAEILYRRTIDALAPGPDDAVVDLYSGVGGLALQAASRGAGFVVGIEEVEGAVARARGAARLNRLNAEFHAGRVEDLLPELVRRLDGVRPLVTVNPARRGLEDGVVEGIGALRPRRLAYVSCNPRALAHDLRRLERFGLRPVAGLELFDMFPNTPHVECLAVLEGPPDEGPARRAPRRKVVRAE